MKADGGLPEQGRQNQHGRQAVERGFESSRERACAPPRPSQDMA